jgi:hypothetical protein
MIVILPRSLLTFGTHRSGRALRRPSIFVGVVAMVATAGILPASAADANVLPTGHTAVADSSFHEYAVGWDLHHGPYDGIGVTRPDITLTNMGQSSDCSSTSTTADGPFVFQSQWVAFGAASDGNWVELGTGHRCNTNMFWYWGYGLKSAWYPLGTKNQAYIGPPATHRFSMWRASNSWTYEVDNTTMQSTTSWGTNAGNEIDFGLESWDANADTAGTPYSGISFLDSHGSSEPISGRESESVDNNMCGQWGNDTQWWAGEGTGCGYPGAAKQSSATDPMPTSGVANRQAALPVSGQLQPGAGLNSAKLGSDCSTTARSSAGTWGTPTSVTAAYGRTAATVHDVEDRNSAAAGQTPTARPAASASPVAVCVIAGDYQVPAPPSPTGASPAYNLAVVTVDAAGNATPYAFGNATSLGPLLASLSAS